MRTLKYVLTASVFAFCLTLAAQTEAFAASAAQQALEKTINQVLGELGKPALKNPATRGQVLDKVETIILTLFDFDELCVRTVGQQWKTFTPAQKSAFKDAFTDLLRERYVGALLGYNGETVSYERESPIGNKGDKVRIDTTVNVNGKPIPMNYSMLNKGRWVVYDISIEGVGMVQNYREQFRSVLTNGTPEQLIERVRALANKTRQDNQSK